MKPQIKVEKRKRLPEIKRKGRKSIPGWESCYPWKIMKVGDSFLVPHDIVGAHFRSQANRACKIWNKKFVLRTTDEGTRCWRVPKIS